MNRESGYRLEIPTSFYFYGTEKATQCLGTRLIEIEEQFKESLNYYLK